MDTRKNYPINIKTNIFKKFIPPFNLKWFGGVHKETDQYFFDRRGAVKIVDTKRIRNGDEVTVKTVSDAGSPMGSDPLALWRPSSGTFVDSARAMDANFGWVYAAVKAIADEISNVEFRIYRAAGEEHEELSEHELIDFLEGVNDFQTGPEFKYTLASHLEITGNAYILLLGNDGKPVKSYEEKPVSMYLLDPSRMKIHLDKTTFPYRIFRYELTVDGRKFPFEPHQVIQIKYPNPSNSFVGLGTVQGIAEWIDNDNYAMEFNRKFFINGARIDGVLETEMTSEEQLFELKASYEEQYAGTNNAHKTLALPKGVKWVANQQNAKDMDFAKLLEVTRDRILAGFRVSKTILGTAESDTNRATAETADYVFSKRTILPKMKLICSYLNEFLVPRFGKDIYISFLDPVPEDKTFRTEEMRTAVAGQAVITQNEARKNYLGLGPIEGGDKLLLANTFSPIGTANNEGDIENSSKRLKKVNKSYRPVRVAKKKTQYARNAETRQSLSKILADRVAEVIIGSRSKTAFEMTADEYNVVLKDKGERITQAAQKFAEEIRKVNEKQKAEVIKNLPEIINSAKSKAVKVSKIFDLKAWRAIVVEAVKPPARDLLGKEASAAAALIGKPGLDVASSPAASKALDHAMSLMADSYTQSTRDLLAAKLTEGIGEGFSVEKLADLVSDIYAWQDQYAAERVALTESNRIANTAAKLAWKESGVVEKLVWITSQRDNVCEFCNAQNGKEISVDDNFYDKGAVIQGADGGEMTADYSAIGGPPLHPNCHCGLKPSELKPIEASIKPEQSVEDEELKALEKLNKVVDDLEEHD